MFSGHIEPIALLSDDINAQLTSLDTNSAMGPDGTHPAVLKYCAPTLLYPLNAIFSRSLAKGMVPMAWKCSTVIPIFKKCHRYELLNYKLVSLTPVCCKVMEHTYHCKVGKVDFCWYSCIPGDFVLRNSD